MAFDVTAGPPPRGNLYCQDATLPAVEADLYNRSAGPGMGASITDPPACYDAWGVSAIIVLTTAGSPSSAAAYVILQTDMGGGNWVDLAWVKSTSTASGDQTFLLLAQIFNGAPRAQTRAAGADPGASGVGTGASVLGTRFRLTGQATLSGGSSPTVKATVRYRLIPFS